MLFVFDHEFVSSRSFYKFIFSFFFKEDDNFSLIFFIPYVVVKTQKKRLSNLAISIFQLVRQPVEAFVESIAGSGTCRLKNKFNEINIQFPVYFLPEKVRRAGGAGSAFAHPASVE